MIYRIFLISSTYLALCISGCSKGCDDDCEKSELLSVTSCSYSHDGTYCLNRYKNGRMSVGSAGVVGEKYCTKGLEVYQE